MDYFDQWQAQAFLIALCLAHAVAVLICDGLNITSF